MNVNEIKVSYSTASIKKVKVRSSDQLYKVAIQHWNLDLIEMQEEVKAILLNRNNEVIGIYELSKGGLTSAVIDIKLLMGVVLKCLASSIAIVHNHPSGNLKASQQDLNITKKIKKACSLFDINLIDHLIISKENFYSFSDSGNI
jgi:DNA repair protein RadC